MDPANIGLVQNPGRLQLEHDGEPDELRARDRLFFGVSDLTSDWLKPNMSRTVLNSSPVSHVSPRASATLWQSPLAFCD